MGGEGGARSQTRRAKSIILCKYWDARTRPKMASRKDVASTSVRRGEFSRLAGILAQAIFRGGQKCKKDYGRMPKRMRGVEKGRGERPGNMSCFCVVVISVGGNTVSDTQHQDESFCQMAGVLGGRRTPSPFPP